MAADLIFVEDAVLDFDLSAIGRKLRIRPDQDKDLELLARLAERAGAVARPKAAAKRCAVQVGGEDQVLVEGVGFTSPLLREKLAECGRAFPCMATEGVELAAWALGLGSFLEQGFATALREAAVEQVEAWLEKTILERYGMKQVSAMNPGSLPIWPIEEQTPLFQLLAPLPEQLGVRLSPNLMMEPAYSISGIFFQTDTKYYNCQLCPREDCPSRRAPSAVL